MQWGHFVCPSSSQKRENTVVLRSAWRLSSPSKQVDRNVVLHVGKRAKFGVEKMNGNQNICSRHTSLGNRKNFKNKLSPLKDYNYNNNYYSLCEFVCGTFMWLLICRCMRDLYNIVKNIELLLACTLYLVLHCISDYIYNYHSIVRNYYITSAILYSLNTVPSADSSIPVTIQPVVTHNMLNITLFVNVRKSFLHSYYSVFLTFVHI